MSVVSAEPVVGTAEVHRGPKRRRSLAVGVAIAVVAAVAAVLLLANRTDSASDAFPPGFGGAGTRVPVPVGEMFLAAMTTELPDVTVLDADPIVAAGSAPVAAEVVACTPRPGKGLLGAGADNIGNWCDSRSISGLDLTSLPDGTYLMLVVVPLAEGPVNISGVEITYRSVGEDGDQRLDWDISFAAS